MWGSLTLAQLVLCVSNVFNFCWVLQGPAENTAIASASADEPEQPEPHTSHPAESSEVFKLLLAAYGLF